VIYCFSFGGRGAFFSSDPSSKMIAALLAAAVAISTAAALQPRAAGFASLSAPSTRAVSRWAPSRANPTSVPIPRRSNLAKASRGGGLRACAAGVGEFPVLLEWLCARNGFVHTGLALAEDDGGAGRGLVATRAIKKGEQMIVVPRAAQLCVPQADEDAQLLAVIDAVEPVPHLRILNIPLALRLLQEKCRPASAFEPYLRMLPASYDTMPDYYAQHIPELQFSNVEQRAVARIKELVRLTGALAASAGEWADAFSGASVDIGLVMWACGTASSRGFGLPWFRGGPLHPVLLFPCRTRKEGRRLGLESIDHVQAPAGAFAGAAGGFGRRHGRAPLSRCRRRGVCTGWPAGGVGRFPARPGAPLRE